MRQLAAFAAILLTAIGCEGGNQPSSGNSGATRGGTLVIASAGEPDVLFPPLTATVTSRQISELVYDHLADLGNSLNTVGDADFKPHLAKSWTWSRDSLSIQFHLDPAARWHDGLPVRASDVAFTYAIYKDTASASPSAPLIADIDSVTTPDSLNAVFWFNKRSPTQFFEATSPMVIIPEHALQGIRGAQLRGSPLARAPIGSGRYRFVSWTPAASVEIAADTANYFGRPNLDRVIWSIAPDPNVAFTRLIGGEADFLEQVSPPELSELSPHHDIHVVLLPGLEYNFIQFNLHDPKNAARPHDVLGDRGVRRALTMAVDRSRTVQSVYDSLAATALGPTVRAYPTTDTTLQEIPYSPDAARRLLDSLGWRVTGADSIRRRNGRPLEFTLTVPGSSKNRVNMAVIIQDQLKQVGAKMNIDKLDFAAFINRETQRKFDAMLGGWHVDASPGGIRQTWGSLGAKPGGSNYGSYMNTAFDAQVDSALSSMTLDDRRARFKRAYQTIIDDAPAIWLAEPRSAVAINNRIHTPTLRPDSWWSSIAEWWVPTAERIARDSVSSRK
ncbi:MAG: peptide ABC transporter substrate-binding protein [Gemmatimonadaceae bacterium]